MSQPDTEKPGSRRPCCPTSMIWPRAYAAADLVISRSGATTVAELAVCGKQAVLIPFPFAADNHQEYNARTLAAIGAADVIIQKDLTPESACGPRSRNTAEARRQGPLPRRIQQQRRSQGSAKTMFKKIKHIHFVGIGGIGMSGIAEVLLNLGYRVSGSDMRESDTTERLRKLGGEVFIGHRAENITAPARRRDLLRGEGRQRGSDRRPGKADPGHPPRGDAGGTDAAQIRRRDCGRSRKNNDHFHGRDGACRRGDRSRPW